MKKFIPYAKLSKKEKRRLDNEKRRTWGNISPVTRKSAKPGAYIRSSKCDWRKEADTE